MPTYQDTPSSTAVLRTADFSSRGCGVTGVGVTDGHGLHHWTAMCPVRCSGCSMCGATVMPLCTSSVSSTVQGEVNHFLCYTATGRHTYLHLPLYQPDPAGRPGRFTGVFVLWLGWWDVTAMRNNQSYWLSCVSFTITSLTPQIEEGGGRICPVPAANMAQVQQGCPPVVLIFIIFQSLTRRVIGVQVRTSCLAITCQNQIR